MPPGPARFYRATGLHRVAVVAIEPATAPGRSLIRLARGGWSRQLKSGTVIGPYDAAELPARYAEVLAELRAEGFAPAGLGAMLDQLRDPRPVVRARAAARLGWRREAEAVGPLLEILPTAVDDACSILDALGMIGDARAIPAVREYAARKLLSRRRSAVEALRHLGDAEGLAEAAARAVASLPEPVRAAFADPGATGAALAESIRAADDKFRGLALDLLDEIATPAAVAAVRAYLDGPEAATVGRPFVWRYVRSLHKRAILRLDGEAVGRLTHLIERQGRRSGGTKAVVRSGYDGVERPTPIFRRATQDYHRRAAWRFLRLLATYRPELYPDAAAWAVVPYAPEDAEEPDGLRGRFGRCYLLNRVLYGGGKRLQLDDRRLGHRFRDSQATEPPAIGREEAFPDLWDARPAAYLRVLADARLPEAHPFAVRALDGPHRATLEAAPPDLVVRLLAAPHPPTVRLGLDELERRFDPARPDLVLIDRVLMSGLPRALEIGRRWLEEAAPAWSADSEGLLSFLLFPGVEVAALAAELAGPTLRDRPDLRRAVAPRVLARLRVPEGVEGLHDVLGQAIRDHLRAEVGALLTLEDLVGMVRAGSPPVQALAGSLLADRPEAVDALGLAGLAALARHEVATVRAAAHALIRANQARFRSDPAPLLLLVEGDWADTRAVAFDLIRRNLDYAALGADGVLGLLDSNRVDVQELGRELARRHRDELPPRFLLERLVEHPHPNVRRFAMDLVAEGLPDGVDALARLEPFFRQVMLAARPDRLLKRRAVDFLLARGLRSRGAAGVAARTLGEFARLAVRADRDHALEAIVRLALAHPDLEGSTVTVAVPTAGGAG